MNRYAELIGVQNAEFQPMIMYRPRIAQALLSIDFSQAHQIVLLPTSISFQVLEHQHETSCQAIQLAQKQANLNYLLLKNLSSNPIYTANSLQSMNL